MVKEALFLLVPLLVAGQGYGRRLVTENSTNLISDGIDDDHASDGSPFFALKRLSSPVTCEPEYGFLPCTTNIWGQLFIIVVYEYLLFLGENYISAGTELIFKLLGPGIFGASAFHILGSLPEAVLVLVAGVSGSIEIAQEQAVIGMALLAGSTVMLLTILWGSIVAVGKYDLSNDSKPTDISVTRRSHLTGFGVVTDLETNYTAKIMLLSLVPFIIVQLPKLLNMPSGERIAIIISLVVSLTLLVSYCFYQVFQPWIQNRRLEYLLHKYAQDNLLQKLLTNDGQPNMTVIKELFQKIDQNGDAYISPAELRALILGIQFEEIGLIKDDFTVQVMKEFDTSGDAHIDEAEFVRGISKWLQESQQTTENQSHHRRNFSRKPSQKSSEEEQEKLVNRQDKSIAVDDKPLWSYAKAAFLLLLGTTILAVLSEPLLDAAQSFSTAAKIPSFFISFVFLPLAVNYREAVSAITTARQKKQRSASLTFSEIYSAVFMNNIVGISIFLVLVYIRGLAWDFSAEVLVVLIVCIVMGLVSGFCNVFPLWTSIVAYLLYPFSLLLVFILIYFFGWL